jgi:Glycosyltransferase family 87
MQARLARLRCRQAMKFTKPDLHLFVLCISALVMFALAGARVIHASNDFVPVYTGARCLLHGCNPYDTRQLEQQFFQAGGHAQELPSWQIDVPVYPPSTFLVLSPLALLKFPFARVLWFLMNGCLFVSAARMIQIICPRPHRWLATILVSYFVITAEIVLVLGQPAVFAISLVVIACCLFLRSRFLGFGALLFLLSLSLKPQIGGLIVLYLLLKRIHWRWAAAAMVGAGAMLVVASLMLTHQPQSAAWGSTLRGNLSATLSPGGSADPRPENYQAIGDLNLQTLTSIFFAQTRTFNAAAYAVFAVLLAVGILVVLRNQLSGEMQWVALAALTILSLIPVYHRFYDSRLLLLSIPAVVIIFGRNRLFGGVLALLTVVTTISVQYRVQIFLLQHAKWQTVFANKFLFILLLRQQNLELLILFCLYLIGLSIGLSSTSKDLPHVAYEPAGYAP